MHTAHSPISPHPKGKNSNAIAYYFYALGVLSAVGAAVIVVAAEI